MKLSTVIFFKKSSTVTPKPSQSFVAKSSTMQRQPSHAYPIASSKLARVGNWMKAHQSLIIGIQWCIILLYLALILIPIFLPLPNDQSRILNHFTVFTQFVFWGIWWPFVLVSMILFGRLWCGVLCPEGALSEWAAKHGRGKAIPRWVRWGGWPFVAFVLTTVYGQMISVYQYPKAVLLILGGSTVAAMGVGFLYAKNKRAWCKYLCPVNGVFALLSKLAPIYFKVDQEKWQQFDAKSQITIQTTNTSQHMVNCAPLQPLAKMTGGSGCHMCGRCSDYRHAITLTARPFGEEAICSKGSALNMWQTALLIIGLLGVAIGAFHWTVSPLFVMSKQWLAEWLVQHEVWWMLDDQHVPWWILTHYPELNDSLTWLDGLTLIFYIGATALVMSLVLFLCLILAIRCAGKWQMSRLHHLAHALIPMAGTGVFLGLSATTLNLIKAEGLPTYWANPARLALLIGASIWSFYLAYRIIKTWQISTVRGSCSFLFIVVAILWIDSSWGWMFWWW